MREKRKRICVHIVGTRWLRLVIFNERGQVWTGAGWSDRRGDARLYADVEVVRREVKRLRRRFRQAEQE
jgi:hypothetical protein